MRLDHLLSKEEEVGVELLSSCQSECKSICLMSEKACFQKRRETNGFIRSAAEREASRRDAESGGRDARTKQQKSNSGGDALRGHTRSHPEHDG